MKICDHGKLATICLRCRDIELTTLRAELDAAKQIIASQEETIGGLEQNDATLRAELATAHARIATLEAERRATVFVHMDRIKAHEIANYDQGKQLEAAQQRIAALEAEREGGPINGPLRMYIALQALRAWNSGTEGFEALTVSTINQWLDDGMKGPIPWPDSPFFAEWAEKRGYANVGGNIGFRFTAELTAAARAGKAGE